MKSHETYDFLLDRWPFCIINLYPLFHCRYDIRNRLEDKSQFGLKPSLPHKISPEEEEFEELLDEERYFSLGTDIKEEELREGVCVCVCTHVHHIEASIVHNEKH